MYKRNRDEWGTIGMSAWHESVPIYSTLSAAPVVNYLKLSHYGGMHIPSCDRQTTSFPRPNIRKQNEPLRYSTGYHQPSAPIPAQTQLKDYYSIRYRAEEYERCRSAPWVGACPNGLFYDEGSSSKNAKKRNQRDHFFDPFSLYYNTKHHHWELDRYYDAQEKATETGDDDEEDDWDEVYYDAVDPDAVEDEFFDACAAPVSLSGNVSWAEQRAYAEYENQCLEEQNRAWYHRLRKRFRDDMASAGLLGKAVAEVENAVRCGKSVEADIEDMLGDCVEDLDGMLSGNLKNALSHEGTRNIMSSSEDIFDENVAELDAIEPLKVEQTYWSLPHQDIDWDKTRLPVPLAQCWGWPPLPEDD